MRVPWGVALACGMSALLGGLLAAWLATGERGDSAAESPARSPEGVPVEEQLATLQRRVAELDGRLEQVRRQWHARQRIEQQVRAVKEGSEEKPPEEGAAPAAIAADNPAFELAVRSVMDRIEWEQEQTREATRAQFRDERARRQTELLSERLGLDTEQADAVRAVLTDQMERFRQLRDVDRPADGPVTREEWRQRIEQLREQTDVELRQILSEAQLREYQQVAEEEGIGGRWMRFGARTRGAQANPTE